MPTITAHRDSALTRPSAWRRIVALDELVAGQPSVLEWLTTEQDAGERVVAAVIRLRGAPLRWSHREQVDHDRMAIELERLGGDLKVLVGSITVEDGDAGGSVVRVDLDVDFGLPRIGTVVNTVLVETLERVLLGAIDLALDAQTAGGGGEPA